LIATSRYFFLTSSRRAAASTGVFSLMSGSFSYVTFVCATTLALQRSISIITNGRK
jgi:hypothetical protein